MELVTEPVIQTAETAGAFAREFQLLLRTLGVAEANMEKGEMRVEANVSVASEVVPSAAITLAVKAATEPTIIGRVRSIRFSHAYR